MAARLADGLKTVLRREGASEDVEISLVLCDDDFIRGLNAQYRGLDRPTDVLSFGQEAPSPPDSGATMTLVDRGPATNGPPAPPESAPSRRASIVGSRVGGPLILGDIVISLPTAVRQAECAGWPLENEVLLLAVHGCLHLLGDDDETDVGAALMQRKAAAALRAIGITPPVEGSHPFFVEYP